MKTRLPADGRSSASPTEPGRIPGRRRGASKNGNDKGSAAVPRPDPSPAFAPFLVADGGAMVGRDAEFARLRAVWAEARAGASRLALVAGEPGVGKSRLVAELARSVDVEDATVVVGRCFRHGTSPYAPFVEALRPALAATPEAWLQSHVDRHGAGITLLFPELTRRLPDVPDKQPASRSQLLGALADVITGIDALHPLLLVVEDLHWATRSTALVLEHLALHPAAAPVLVVGTYRDDAITPNHPMADFLDRAASELRVDKVALGNLSAPAVAALLSDRIELMGERADALGVELWRATEGHPLVLTEALTEMLTASSLSDVGLSGEDVAEAPVPHDTAGLVARRMGRCRLTTRQVVEAASIVGPSFTLGQVAALTELKEHHLRDALQRGIDAGLLVDAKSPDEPDRYRFIHALVQEAVYRAIPANRKVRLHHQLADTTEAAGANGGPASAALVHHLSAASPVGRSPEAVGHAQRAADAAMDVLAFEEAADFYGQALAFLGTDGDPALRTDLLIALGDANHRAGESARARQSYLQAAASARASQDGPRLGRAVLGIGDVMGTWGTDGLLIGLLEQALEANAEDPPLRAALTARLAQARAVLDNPDQRKAQSDEAWELAWDSLDSSTIGRVLRARHEALSAPDDLEDRLEADGELVAIATAADDDELSIEALAWRSVDLLERGFLTEADRDRQAHAKLARRLGDPRHLADAARWAAMRALVDGKPRKVTSSMQKAVTLATEARDPETSSVYWTQQHALLLDWGDDAELTRLAEAWLSPGRGDDGGLSWRSSLALLLVRAGRWDEALEDLEDLLDETAGEVPLDRSWLSTVGALGEVAAVLGDARCADLARRLAPYGDRLIVVGPGLVCRGPVSRVVGLLWARAGRWAEAERQFHAALETAERVGSLPFLARARADFGRAMAGQPGGPLHLGRNRAILVQAADDAERAGMTRLAREVRATLEALPEG